MFSIIQGAYSYRCPVFSIQYCSEDAGHIRYIYNCTGGGMLSPPLMIKHIYIYDFEQVVYFSHELKYYITHKFM